MSKLIHSYLNSESKALHLVFTKLKQLQQWNAHLHASLGLDDPLRGHCYIVNLAANVLIVIVDNPHWATRFRFHVPELLVRMQQCPGLANIKGICCKVHPGHNKPAPQTSRAPEKLSTGASASLQETARKISDDKLKAVLERLAMRTK